MRPLLTIALTAFLGISIVVAYRVYQVGKHRKNRKKPPVAQRKLKRTEPAQKGSGEKAASSMEVPLRTTGSDILHPAPFDNVTGTMSVPKCTRPKKLSKEDDLGSGMDTTKLEGSRMESESQEIKKMPFSFEKCEAATFVPAKTNTEEKDKQIECETPPPQSKINEPTPENPKTSENSEANSAIQEKPAETVSAAAPPTAEKVAEKAPEQTKTEKLDDKGPVENKMARMMGSNEKSSSNESANPPPAFPVPPPLLQTAPSLENTSSPSSPASMNPSASLDESAPRSRLSDSAPTALAISSCSTTSSTGGGTKPMFKVCRCRKTGRGECLSNADAPSYDAGVKAEIPATIVMPVNFTKYRPPNLLEPPGKKDEKALEELPDVYFSPRDAKPDTYLTPLYPVLGAVHAAHHHACLINHIIENYDFFE